MRVSVNSKVLGAEDAREGTDKIVLGDGGNTV